jgi:hypothetical protein
MPLSVGCVLFDYRGGHRPGHRFNLLHLQAVLRVLGIVLVACLVTGTGACSHSRRMQPTITLQEAGERAISYARAAVAQLPGNPKVIGPTRISVPCDGLYGDGPNVRVHLADDYHLDYGFSWPDHTSLINHMYQYWAGLGYQTIRDTRGDNFGRAIHLENPTDNFDFGLIEDITNTVLTLQITAPCVWPNGTPPPE